MARWIRMVVLVVLLHASSASAQQAVDKESAGLASVGAYLDEDTCLLASLAVGDANEWPIESWSGLAKEWLGMELPSGDLSRIRMVRDALVRGGTTRLFVIAGNPAQALSDGPLVVLPASEPEVVRKALEATELAKVVERATGAADIVMRVDRDCVLVGRDALVTRALARPERGPEALRRLVKTDDRLHLAFAPTPMLRELLSSMWETAVRLDPDRPRDFAPFLGMTSLVAAVPHSGGLVRMDVGFEGAEQAGQVARFLKEPMTQVFGTEAEAWLPLVQGNHVVMQVELGAPVLDMVKMSLRGSREAAGRAKDINSMKQISLAMHNYESARKRLPPQALADRQGRKLLSWRVLLLPYLGQQDLYDRFHLEEPWDSPHNRGLISQMPEIYRGASTADGASGITPFVAPLTRNSLLGRPGAAARFEEVTDGTSNTVWLVRVPDTQRVVWTRPEDWRVPEQEPLDALRRGGETFLGARVDGSVQAFDSRMTDDAFRSFLSIDGGTP